MDYEEDRQFVLGGLRLGDVKGILGMRGDFLFFALFFVLFCFVFCF